MSDFFRVLLKRIPLFAFLIPLSINAQILSDSASLNLVKDCINNLYNLHFENTRDGCRKLNLSYPGNPDVYLINGMITYWENFPMISNSPVRASFEYDLNKCIEICEANTNPKNEAEFLLANLSARGMLLQYYTDNSMDKEVFPLVISTYKYIRRSFDFTSSFNDFYFFTGLYNYYREAYPEAYPAYKALAFLFPKGDKLRGMDELHIAARNSLLFKAEASSFLSEICLSFENNSEQALEHSKYLHELYPANIQYLSMYITNLLLLKEYDEAENHIVQLSKITISSYFMAKLSIFKGIIQEKKYHNNNLAEQYYQYGIDGMKPFGYFGNEFEAYGYFGLSRISADKNDNNSGNAYRKKALELADFKKVDFN